MTIQSITGSDAVRAFRHRNYRLFFSGQAVSLVGDPRDLTRQDG